MWKNAESAFTGTGDIDAAAPDTSWPTVTAVFADWAREHGVGPAVVCPHIPGGLNLVAAPHDSATLLEMGTKGRRVWRGTTLFVLDDLRPLMVLDERGFRRIRTGAEGLFKLALNGIRWDGRPNQPAIAAKRVRDQLAADRDGYVAAARLFGFAGDAAVAAADAVVAGGWSYPAVMRWQAWAAGRVLREPGVATRRLRFRLVGRQSCPVVRTLLEDARRIPADRDRWMAEVARDHEVLG